jgi:hypothetical protein
MLVKGQIIRSSSVLVLILLVVLTSGIGCQKKQSAKDRGAAHAEVTLAGEGEPAVELAIDYGDGCEKRFRRIPYKHGMTVLAALEFAAAHPRGIKFESSGAGESALLTSIDDLSNEGGRDGRNWIYRVNGKLATKSFDAYTLSPNDVILWKFEQYE